MQWHQLDHVQTICSSLDWMSECLNVFIITSDKPQMKLHYCRQITTPTPHHSIFTARMLFLMPNQQCQSTEVTTHTQPFNGLLSGTTRVGRYQKKHSPTYTHPDHRTSFIIFLHLQRSMASCLFSLRAWQSSRTTSLQVLFGLPLGLGPSTS